MVISKPPRRAMITAWESNLNKARKKSGGGGGERRGWERQEEEGRKRMPVCLKRATTHWQGVRPFRVLWHKVHTGKPPNGVKRNQSLTSVHCLVLGTFIASLGVFLMGHRSDAMGATKLGFFSSSGFRKGTQATLQHNHWQSIHNRMSHRGAP